MSTKWAVDNDMVFENGLRSLLRRWSGLTAHYNPSSPT